MFNIKSRITNSDTQNTQFTERNTNTIKNTNVRKLTSIALMTIMVAGGLTFAIPGMEPAEAAQISSNPNLKVSAEGQNAGNEIASTNIIEIIVSDGDVNENTDSILVTAGGNDITMTFYSGAWYAYIADRSIQGTGLIGADDDDDDVVSADEQRLIDGLVNDAPIDAADVAGASEDDDIDTTGLLVQVLNLGEGEFDIIYEKPANAQTVTLDLDDPDSGVSLDRTNYSRGTDVVITIDDLALNVDPTDTDAWFLNTAGNAYYGATETGVELRANAEAKLADDKARAGAQKIADLADAVLPADAIRIALAERDRLQTIAQAAVDNELLLETDAQKINARNILGTGATIDENDGQTAIDASIGTAQATYEETAGAPARGNVEASEGSAQSDYDVIVGVGAKNVPTEITNASDAEASQTDMDDDSFMGTAEYTYQRALAIAQFEYDEVVVGVDGNSYCWSSTND